MGSRVALLVLLSGAVLAAVAGCHTSLSADVVATVNGKQILRADLERNYQSSLGGAPQKLSPEEADIRRLTILHQMIQDEMVQQRAAKLNLPPRMKTSTPSLPKSRPPTRRKSSTTSSSSATCRSTISSAKSAAR